MAHLADATFYLGRPVAGGQFDGDPSNPDTYFDQAPKIGTREALFPDPEVSLASLDVSRTAPSLGLRSLPPINFVVRPNLPLFLLIV